MVGGERLGGVGRWECGESNYTQVLGGVESSVAQPGRLGVKDLVPPPSGGYRKVLPEKPTTWQFWLQV